MEKRTAPTTVSKGEMGGRRERVGVGCVCVREVEGCDEEEKTMRSDDRGKIETRRELSESVVSTDRVRTRLWGNGCTFSLGPATVRSVRPYSSPSSAAVSNIGVHHCQMEFLHDSYCPMLCHVKCKAPGPER